MTVSIHVSEGMDFGEMRSKRLYDVTGTPTQRTEGMPALKKLSDVIEGYIDFDSNYKAGVRRFVV